jgi:hypothetical protein
MTNTKKDDIQFDYKYGFSMKENYKFKAKKGTEILKIVNEWENKLCAHSEKAGYSNYTGGLAEKFRQELRSAFPMIDYVGIISKKSNFNLKKIL